MSDKKTYFTRAIEISVSPENCQDDNWGDWANLCGEADLEIKVLKKKLDAAVEALRDLYDEQNGPPLIRHQSTWQAAMDKTCKILKEIE